MKCRIVHASRGRLRVRMAQSRMTLEQADILEYALRAADGVKDVKVYDRTCDVVVFYSGKQEDIISFLAGFSYENSLALVPDHTGRALSREFEDKLSSAIMRRVLSKLLLPAPVRAVISAIRSVKYIVRGLDCLRRGKLEVPVLDATAITVSLLRGDWSTASSIMFLLGVGEILEEWTHKKSVDDLARAMSLNIDKVWLRTESGEVSTPIGSVSVGDMVVVRTGSVIPLDGKVAEGEAMVSQATITGEPLPVQKTIGSYVYAGTVVEEGECVVRVEKALGSGRYDRIVHMIEESEKLKSEVEDQASHLADKLVPYSLGGTALTWLLTRNVTKALSILMVDFSCALKLAMPISVLSAMREGRGYHIAVKGGKFLEAVSQAETIVFDKTGTLTRACPTVADIITFGDKERDDMLRLAACLEEHYPHSIANAVVAESKRRGLMHEERHSKVEYVVAHGISSTVEGEKVVIGSHHFVFQDEGCVVPEGDEEKFETLPVKYSHLYLAIGGVLAAVICIEDPLREEAIPVIRRLHELGIKRVVMMTGDSDRTAKAVAQAVGVDEYHSEVLPEDKAEFIRREHAAGRKVIMIGDGVNDSPALSEADAGIAMGTGAAIAKEVADITLATEDLRSLVTLRQLSSALMKRIHGNYRFIMGFNGSLIALGVAGVLQPATSALLHNISTLAIGLRSMTNLLDEEQIESL